jgi:hypothetical protein
MAKIIIKSEGITPETMFRMMNGKTDGLKSAVGDKFDVVECAEIEQTDMNGEPVTVVFIVTDDGRVFGSNSATVRRTFEALVESFGLPTPFLPYKNMTVVEKASKKGRNYLDLDFAG